MNDLNTKRRIAIFGASLLAVAIAAAWAGSILDPAVGETEHEGANQMEDHDTGHGGSVPGAAGADVDGHGLPGLSVAASGYRLVPDRTTLEPSAGERFSFRVVGEDGQTVQDFDTEHARRMHLILVRRDFANFQHVHPEQQEDGSWQSELDLELPGVYRVFADFSTGGRSLTLAADLFVAGAFEPESLPPATAVADAGSGYEVSLDGAEPRAGAATPVSFSVSLNGREVAEVEPYLGADGHLVALRQHDQAFLHTHPEGEAGGGGPIAFGVEYPTPGRYRLFLQFRHDGVVRTAAFTQDVAEPGAVDDQPAIAEEEETHGH